MVIVFLLNLLLNNNLTALRRELVLLIKQLEVLLLLLARSAINLLVISHEGLGDVLAAPECPFSRQGLLDLEQISLEVQAIQETAAVTSHACTRVGIVSLVVI